jgi:hypothetical protein
MLALVFGFAVAAACSLNPQPEVPSGASGGKGGLGTGGSGGGAGGSGGSGAVGIGGGTSGGAAGAGGTGGGGLDATAGPCAPGCASGELCNDGACVQDLCAGSANNCDADQACKPNAAFTAVDCVTTCADVTCGTGETCRDGQCVTTGCSSDCATGEVCLPDGDGGYECVPDPCLADGGKSCAATEVCDSQSADCVPDPCTGVACPANQECVWGECLWSAEAGSDAAAD